MSQQPWIREGAAKCPEEWAEVQRCLGELTSIKPGASSESAITAYRAYRDACQQLRAAWEAATQAAQ